MRRFLLPVVIAAVLALSGCDWVLSLFGSEEAAIVTFSFEGIEGTASIDPEARAVEIEIIPIDLSTVTPVVEVSEGAMLGELPAFVDGEPATIEVTAENGEVVEWTVTVTLQLGLSFLLNGERVVLQGGYTNSGSQAEADELYNGQPPGSVDSFDSALGVSVPDEVIDWGAEESAFHLMELYLSSSAVGSYTYGTGDFSLYYYLDADRNFVDEIWFVQESGEVSVTGTGAVGGIITGTFGAGGVNEMDSGPLAITNGFFKVRRIADDRFLLG